MARSSTPTARVSMPPGERGLLGEREAGAGELGVEGWEAQGVLTIFCEGEGTIQCWTAQILGSRFNFQESHPLLVSRIHRIISASNSQTRRENIDSTYDVGL